MENLLTDRELEVLAHALLLNREIAARLGISHKTVAQHFNSIFHKLDEMAGLGDVGKLGGRTRRTAAVVKALHLGWLSFDDIVWPGDGGERRQGDGEIRLDIEDRLWPM